MTTLAHAGGLHEAALVLGPLVLVVILLRLGAKKAPPDDDPDETDQEQVT